jgi:hypothetical protein
MGITIVEIETLVGSTGEDVVIGGEDRSGPVGSRKKDDVIVGRRRGEEIAAQDKIIISAQSGSLEGL